MTSTSSSDHLTLKTVIRTQDFDASKRFYNEILKLLIVQEWHDDPDKGCIMSISADRQEALVEIIEVEPGSPFYDPAYENQVHSDKVHIQIQTDNVEYWESRLSKYGVPFEGPLSKPWNSRYLYVRDPDGLQIIIHSKH